MSRKAHGFGANGGWLSRFPSTSRRFDLDRKSRHGACDDESSLPRLAVAGRGH
jgi:hypothetical protein